MKRKIMLLVLSVRMSRLSLWSKRQQLSSAAGFQFQRTYPAIEIFRPSLGDVYRETSNEDLETVLSSTGQGQIFCFGS